MNMNEQRVEWAARALKTVSVGEPNQGSLTDLLTDLQHWADKNNIEFTDCLLESRFHYNHEKRKAA